MIAFSLHAAAQTVPDNNTPHKGTPDAMKYWTL